MYVMKRNWIFEAHRVIEIKGEPEGREEDK
jgi:hypothetical protein